VRPSYTTVVLGPVQAALSSWDMDGIFDDIAHAVGGAVKSVAHVADDVVHGRVGDAVKDVVHIGGDIVKAVGEGASAIDHVLMEAAKHVKDLGIVLQVAQLGLSFIPGIGQGINAAIGAGLALAEGKPITDALIEAVKGAVPGGPLVAAAVDTGIRGAVDFASGKSLDAVALDAMRSNLPGGDVAKVAFDTGLALSQAKVTQAARHGQPATWVPREPVALSSFAMTRRLLQGQSPQGAAHAALARLKAINVRPAHPALHPHPALHRAPARTLRAYARSQGDASPSHTSHVVPMVLGAAGLAAAGGGAWWWWKRHHAH
jgi:hypothetical protein